MLDSVLVEHVLGIHRQKQSGVLSAAGAVTTMRFAFQNGDPVAIDFGLPKDVLLANTLLAYHRLTDTQCAEATANFSAGKGSVLQFVTGNRYATPQEVALATQGMVEDTLCQVFSTGQLTLSFIPDAGTEDFDFAKQAMRLKIPADLLLRTTSARVAENRSLVGEFGDFTGVYALTETEVASTALTDAEKRVLNVVDGRATVREIAVLARDSDLNVARILRALVNKRIVRRLHQTTKIVNSNTTVSLPPGAATGATATASGVRAAAPADAAPEFTPYRTTEPAAGGSRATTIILGAVLVTMVGVGALVLHSLDQQRELREATDRFNELFAHSDWAGAQAAIDAARTKAGTDLESLQRVAQLEKLVQEALANEMKSIRKLVSGGDFPAGRARWARLPPGPATEALHLEIDQAEASFEERRRTIADQVQKLLADGKLDEAVAQLKSDGGNDRLLEPAQRELEAWQLTQIESLSAVTIPLWRRLEVAALVRRSAPTGRPLKLLEAGETALAERQVQITAMLPSLADRITAGSDMLGLVAEIDRLRNEVVRTPLEADLTALKSRVESVKATADEFQSQVVAAIRAIDNPDLLKAAVVTSGTLVPEGTAVPDNPIGQLVTVVRAIAATTTLEGAETQAKAVQVVAVGKSLPQPLTSAIAVRVDLLNNLERTASGMLDTSRVLAKEGDLSAARLLLTSLLGREDLRGTAARAFADPDLVALEVRIAHRKELEAQLKDVIARGDLGAGTALAREMGLRYLPLAIDSIPSGASVWKDGAELGTTPLVLEMSAADRVDQVFELRLPGYQNRQVTGAEAEAGWRLVAPLERNPAVTTSLKGLVTSQPVVINDVLLAADRVALRQLDAQGTVTTIGFADAGVDLPLYAAPSLAGKSLVLTTRSRVGLKIVGDAAVRFPLPAGSDFPFISYQSQIIVDRHYVVVASLEGRLQAIDVRDPRARWSGPGGASFAAGPMLAGDRFRTVRSDGVLEEITADDGRVSITAAIGAPVVAAWPKDGGFAGCTATESWTWNGTEIHRETLPTPVAFAASNVLVSQTNRVWTATGGTWKELRRVDGTVTQPPLLWGDQVVITMGKTVQVLGNRGFTATFPSEVLPPLVWKDRLTLVSQDGTVRIYDR